MMRMRVSGMPGEFGECVVRKESDGNLTIISADPLIKISLEIWQQIVSGSHHPRATIDDDVLTIRAVNRTVVYRVWPSPFATDLGRCLIGQWPD